MYVTVYQPDFIEYYDFQLQENIHDNLPGHMPILSFMIFETPTKFHTGLWFRLWPWLLLYPFPMLGDQLLIFI
jgi:hypothetical protein